LYDRQRLYRLSARQSQSRRHFPSPLSSHNAPHRRNRLLHPLSQETPHPLPVRTLLHAVILSPGTMQRDRFSCLSSLCRTACRHPPLHRRDRASIPANRFLQYPYDRTTEIGLYFHHCPSASQRNCFCSPKGRSLHTEDLPLRSSR